MFDFHHTLLSADEERALIAAAQQGDGDALEALVRHNVRLVKKVASRWHIDDPATTFDDLMQRGMLGLLTAVRKFDLSQNVRFSTYATWWIRRNISHLAITAGAIPRPSNPYYQPRRELSVHHRALRSAPVSSLDAPLRADTDSASLADILPDASGSVEDVALNNIEAERIWRALDLPPRAAAVVMDWLHENSESRSDVQRRHGMSRNYIYSVLESRKGKFIMSEKTCSVEGCDQPRMVTASGVVQPRCEEHQRRFWRENQARKTARVSAVLAGTNGQQPNPHPQPDAQTSTQPDAPAPAPGCQTACDDCLYREVVSLLAAKNPRIRQLVDHLEAARRLRDDLGI